MDNKTYSASVNEGNYPDEPLVPLDAPFVNKNGAIQNLLLSGFTSVAIIDSLPGALRANHYHKTDWHYTYVISGVVDYYWRGIKGTPNENVQDSDAYREGEMFFTPPMMAHAMYFTKKTSILTLARNIRDHEHHEADLVRIEIVKVDENGNIKWVL